MRSTVVTVALVAAFGVACGANASGGVDEGDPGPQLETVTSAARPGEAASDDPPAAPAAEDPAGATSAEPAVPLPGLPAPAPLPSAELDSPRPILDRLAPAEVVLPPGDCRFEFLGEWVRCENAGWPNAVASDAPDLQTCMQRCVERDDCTAVTDYLWLGLPDLGCYLYLSSCDAPARVVWGEEDAGRDFKRSCASAE